MTDPLSYDSLYDPHLQTYFQNKNIRKHLRKVGFINRYDEIIPDKQYKAIVNERYRQEHIRALLSYGVVRRVMELEKFRQANIRNQLEANAKRMLVENIKESRQQYRQLSSKDFVLYNRPKTSISNNNYHVYQQQQQQIKIIDENREIRSRLSSINHPSRSSTKTILSARHKSSKLIKSNINRKDECEITMIFFGPQKNINYDQSLCQSNGYQITVMQQHCEGQNIILFKNYLKPNEKFTFRSRRHFEYPFALSLYVNGLIDCRISVCCEYKHKIGVPLTGKQASFAICNVQGGQPCQICRLNEYMLNYPLSKHKTLDKNSISTDKSQKQTSDDFGRHHLLCTPTLCDEHESDTIIFNENGEYREIEEMYENLLKKVNDNLSWEENSRFQWQLGNICKEGLGDYERALDHYLMSVKILCEHISPLDIKLRNIYLSIGHVLILQEKNETSSIIEYFQRVLDIDCSINNICENNLIHDHYYLGLLYQNQDNYHQALFHFKKSLHFFLLNKSKKNFHFNLNDNYYSINQTIYDKKALESLSINNLPNLSDIHFNLATTYQNLQQKQNALKHAQKAFQLSTYDQNKFNHYQDYFKKLQQI
ncbi:unnamed protein product [Rotaria sordida]|uniref:DUF4590 domain-containing protein n=1 Tax=Rotaria sordida TaxID=392033 RepID=A0A819DYW5_9BILA|nr:unnamed protein product [Rotaria sordida]CAF3841459.1 unnamed protein product [Rotaria sordida]